MTTDGSAETTDPVALLRSQFASPVSIMGGESYALDLDAVRRLLDEVERLRAALKPFAELAKTKTVAHGYQAGILLTLSNGEKMCAVDPKTIMDAHAALEPTHE